MRWHARTVRPVQLGVVVLATAAWGYSTWVMAGAWLAGGIPSAVPAAALAVVCFATWTACLIPELAFFLLGRANCYVAARTPGQKFGGVKPVLPDAPRVAILYTTADDFSAEAVDSLLAQTHPGCRVFILDDGRRAETREAIDRYRIGRDVTLVRRPDRKGYKAGNLNHCLERIASEFELFAVFDGDNLADPRLVEACLRRFRDPCVGFVVGRKLALPDQQQGLARHLRHITSVWYDGSLRIQQNLGVTIFDGHGGVIRVDAWREAGGFPVTSTEDIAFAVSSRMHGWYGVYERDALSFEEFPASVAQLLKRNEKWTRGLLDSMRRCLWGFLSNRRIALSEKLDLIRIVILHVSPMLALLTVLFTTLAFRADAFVGERMWNAGGAHLLVVLLYAGLIPVIGSLWRRPLVLVDTVIWANLVFVGSAIRNALDVLAFLVSRSSVFGVTATNVDVEVSAARGSPGGWWQRPKSSDPTVALISAAGGLLMLVIGFEMQSIWLLPFGVGALTIEFLRVRHEPWVGRVAGAACLSLVVLVSVELFELRT